MPEDCCCDFNWEFLYTPSPVSECPDADCDESDCIDFGEIESCSECAEAPKRYTVDFGSPPCFACCENAGGSHTFVHVSGCTWETDDFSCGSDNYLWRLTIDSPTTTLSLVKNFGAGTTIEVEYVRTGWNCLCVNEMTLDSSANCDSARAVICVAPVDIIDYFGCGDCADGAPSCWELVIAGVTDNGCLFCANIDGTYVIETLITSCSWRSTFGEICTNIPSQRSDLRIRITSRSDGSGLVQFQTSVLGDIATYEVDPFDCTGPNTLSKTGDIPGKCNFPATVTIQPVSCD